MSKFKVKKLPPIRLVDLLKKRKTNLKDFLKFSGIITYVTLEGKCEKMGVSAPTEIEFASAIGNVIVSSPQEGIVVLDSPVLLKDTGEKVLVDDVKTAIVENDSFSESAAVVLEKNPLALLHKSSKKKRETNIEES